MNIYNSEMYPDPTAYHALTKIHKEEKAARYRPLVYICSPYSGDVAKNTEKAKRHCRFAVDNNDSEDFPEISIRALQEMLEQAYLLGRADAEAAR